MSLRGLQWSSSHSGVLGLLVNLPRLGCRKQLGGASCMRMGPNESNEVKFFKRSSNANFGFDIADYELVEVFGTEAPFERSVSACFQRFKAGNKKLQDEPRSGRTTAISFDEPRNLAERYFVASLGCSQSLVSNGLRSLEMVKKLGSSWNLPFRTAAGQHDNYCRGLLSSAAKTGRQDPQGAPEARKRSPAAR
ncbi:hypothetical protein RB195_001019 [Necator americanus]|uniref:Mos1 transposase HTH domain-containing protein n=1 Tax=Necator americanus TaxID=51031 RepID=A0ABR1DD76_NECAM